MRYSNSHRHTEQMVVAKGKGMVGGQKQLRKIRGTDLQIRINESQYGM